MRLSRKSKVESRKSKVDSLADTPLYLIIYE